MVLKEQSRLNEGEVNPNDKIRKELETEGWQRASGIEDTHTTPLNPATGRFEPKSYRSPDDIEKEYLEKYSKQGFTELKLVRRYSWKDKMGWVEDSYSYYVYMRRQQDKK